MADTQPPDPPQAVEQAAPKTNANKNKKKKDAKKKKQGLPPPSTTEGIAHGAAAQPTANVVHLTPASPSPASPNGTSKLDAAAKSKVTAPTTSTASAPKQSESEEAEGKSSFSDELAWCIKKIEAGLLSGSPDARQKSESEKAIVVLKSASAPLVKKRHTMQKYCGDYRKLMRDEAKAPPAVAVKENIRGMKIAPVATDKQQMRFFRVAKSSKAAIDTQNGTAKADAPVTAPQTEAAPTVSVGSDATHAPSPSADVSAGVSGGKSKSKGKGKKKKSGASSASGVTATAPTHSFPRTASLFGSAAVEGEFKFGFS